MTFAALYLLSLIAQAVCAIMVLVALFKNKGALHGILGLLCGFYPYIWGWINAKQLNLTKLMIIWTVGMVVMFGSLPGALAYIQTMQQQTVQQPQVQP